MRMSNRDFNTVIEKAGLKDEFVATRKSHMELRSSPEDSDEIRKKKLTEAGELAFDAFYPVALALKHGLNINGSGKIKTNLNLEELTSKGDPTRDASWVYEYLHFDDVCDFGAKPTYNKQPIAPSPTAYAIWCAYKHMDKGFEEFMKSFYFKYGPQKKDIELMQKNRDDGRELKELNTNIADAKRKSEALARKKALN